MLEEVSHRVGKTVDQLLINDFKGYADVAKRGATSFEAKQIEASKNYDSRARKLGYDNVVDRFDKDATFALRSKDTIARASTKCLSVGFVSSPKFHGVTISDFSGLGQAMENEVSIT